MSDLQAPLARDGEGFALRLSPGERDLLRGLCGQLRELLRDADPSGDPAIARLFPAAYPDDPLRSLDFERGAGSGLVADRLAAVDLVETTVAAEHLSEDEVIAWLGSVNALRLVLGTRLAITEETTEADYPEGNPDRDTYGMYLYLTWLEAGIVEGLSGE
ncbi:MAG: DUF2017 family protein [Actinomycetota bacterium]